jgi:tetratricopeptide (TPR) repeat protein
VRLDGEPELVREVLADGGGAPRKRRAACRMRTSLLIVAAAAAFSMPAAAPAQTSAAAPEAVRLESSPQLFAVLAALEEAGFQADATPAEFAPWIEPVREELRKGKGPAVEALRQYYQSHLLGTRGETLSRYISFALVAGPPPTFAFHAGPAGTPPDARTIQDFGEVLANFYREQQVARLWKQLEPRYARQEARLVPAVSRMVQVSAGYLREIVPASTRRSFTVYVEPLAGNVVNARLYGDRYAIVVNPAPRVPLEQIRHAFLHFLLDPLPLGNPGPVMAKQALLNIAARAPQLPEAFKSDFLALADECLVQAVELRLRHLGPAGVAAALDDADRSGYVLVRPIYGRLAAFEKSEETFTQFFPRLIEGIDLKAETRREEQIHFADVQPGGQGGAPAREASALGARLAAGDREIAEGNAAAAAAAFEDVLASYPDNQRARYGLAVSSVLLGKAERAEKLFEQLVEGQPAGDPTILTWSHVYLGRMRDLEGDRAGAVEQYRAALAVEGAPEAARLAARRGLTAPYAPPAGKAGHAPPQ